MSSFRRIQPLTLGIVQTLAKAKAPIVAIPMEKRVPVCVDRKRLAGWLKEVRLISATLVQLPDQEGFERPKRPWDNELDRNPFWKWDSRPEGPEKRIVTPGEYRIELKGTSSHWDGTGNPRVRCTCQIMPVARHEALKIIRKWADAERERQQKRILRGALDAKTRKELKRAQYEETPNAQTVVTNYSVPAKNRNEGEAARIEVRWGIPVTIPEVADMELVLVRNVSGAGESWESVEWSVTERRTGLGAGTGNTAEAAIIAARARFRTAKPETLAGIRAQIARAPLPHDLIPGAMVCATMPRSVEAAA